MKKVIIMALAFLAIAGCKKPKDSDNYADYIVGVWNIDELEADITTEIFGNPVQIPADAISLNGYYQFNSDKTFKYSIDTQMEILIPTVGVDTIPYKDDQQGTYELIDDNDIRLISQNGTTVMVVKSKSPTTIIGKIYESIDTMSISLDMEIEMILRK